MGNDTWPRERRAAINAILAESRRIGWPLSFATDIEYDKTAILQVPEGTPFGWALRASGTHLCHATVEAIRGWAGERMRSPSPPCCFARAVREAFDEGPNALGDRGNLFYLWDGVALHSVKTAEELDDRLHRLTYPSKENDDA